MAKNKNITHLLENLCEEFYFEYGQYYALTTDEKGEQYLSSKDQPFINDGDDPHEALFEASMALKIKKGKGILG